MADTCIKFVVSYYSQRALSSGLSLLKLRRWLSCAGFFSFGTCVLACAYVPRNSAWITSFLVVAKAGSSLHSTGFKANYLDLTVRDTGAVMGVGNTLATLTSMIAPLVAGHVLETFGWEHMFQLVFLVNMSGALVFGLFVSTSCLDEMGRGAVKEKEKQR